MIILAHTIVPHHHHNKAFAAVVSIIDGGNQQEAAHHHGAAHHHDDTGKSEACLINEAYVATFRVQNEDSGTRLLHIGLDWHPLFTTACLSFAIPIQQALPFRQRPYIELIHPIFLTHSFGLRAPPSC